MAHRATPGYPTTAATDMIMDFLVAPTEPATLREMGATTLLPERYGCDVMWRAHGKWWGVQRKEIKDFIASVLDGRLAKEVGQMRGRVVMPMVVIEGRPMFSESGMMLRHYGRPIGKAAYEGMLFSLAHEGVAVMHARDTADTASMIRNLAAWSVKDSHTSLLRRPGPEPVTMWGGAGNEDWAKHLLMGFQGIGPVQAAAIVAHFHGVPLAWMCTEGELRAVKGIGPKRAAVLVAALAHGQPA